MNDSVKTLTLNDGNTIPQLGLGVWKASDDEAEQAVRDAIKSGYRLIDTATIYGNEAGVGRGVASSGVARGDLFITTKLWNADQGYDNTMKAFDKSLELLNLDYIDLYLIHWPVPAKDVYVDTWKAFEQLQKDGRVKSIGVCNFKPHHLEKLIGQTDVVPAVNQVELHPRFTQAETRAYCDDHNIRVESWSPIGGSSNVASLMEDATLKAIAQAHAKSVVQVILRWHLQLGLIVIPKSVHLERIQENIDVFDFDLNDDELSRISALHSDVRQGPDPDTMNNS